jgi:hypothetical protein
MTEKKDWIAIFVSILLMAIILNFKSDTLAQIIRFFLISFMIIIFVVLAKKIAANYLDVKLNFKIWEFQRYGVEQHSHFQKPFPIGLIIPLLLALISRGWLNFLAFLQYDSYALPTKVVKRYGQRRFSEIMEWDDALIVFYSLIPLLGLGILSIILSKYIAPIFFLQLAKVAWIYVFSNMLPISQLDGTKMFFGSIPLYIFSWIIILLVWPIIFI